MAVYRYTLLKYCKSYSTWIIGLISILIVILVGGFLPFTYAQSHRVDYYAVLSVSIVSMVTSFMSVFSSVFAGFKAASMYRDEVEDGTFLVMLSKPIPRREIILYKWLALQTMIFVYTFTIALTFLFTILIFDTGSKLALSELSALGLKTLSSQVVTVSLSMWAILFIVSLIFSSIALMLSTKLSLGTTIGISIAIGVVIPITSLIATFTSKPTYDSVSEDRINDKQLIFSMQGESIAKEIHEKVPQLNTTNVLLDDFVVELKNMVKITSSHNKDSLYGLGFHNSESDSFQVGQYFSLNFQIQKLSEFASEQAIPKSVRERGVFVDSAKSLRIITNKAIDDNPFANEKLSEIDAFNHLIVSSWNQTTRFRSVATKLLFELLNLANISTPIYIGTPYGDGNFTTLVTRNPNGKTNGILIDNQNKAQFIQDISAPDSLLTWISKTGDEIDTFTHDESVRYSNAILAASSLLLELAQTKGVLDFSLLNNFLGESSNFDEYFRSFVWQIYSVYNPITYWVSFYYLKKLIDMHHLSASKEYILKSENIQQNTKDDILTNSLGNLRETVRQIDRQYYNGIVLLANNGFHIARVENTEYTSKWTILWIYLSIALVLVPLSYFVVRKQDFR